MGRIKKIKEKLYKNDIQKIVTTIFAQGMLSVTNFAIGIIIAKYATKSEYGMYVLFFSFIGILSSFHNAVISSPLMVLAGQKRIDERESYVVSLTIGRHYILLPMLFVFSAALLTYNAFVVHERSYMIMSIFISIVIIAFTAKEFQRTVHFTLLNTSTIFMMDMAMMVTVFLGVFTILYYDIVNSISGMAVLFLGYVSSYIYAKVKNPYRDKSRIAVGEAIKENWRHGRWLIIGILSSTVQNRSYIYITTLFMGLGALADVSASRLFMMPMMLLSGSIVKIMVAKGSLMVAENEHRKLSLFLLYFTILLTCVWLVYVTIVMGFSDSLIGFLGEKYSNTKNLILLWGIYVLVMTLKSMLTTGIIVYKRFQEQAIFDLAGAVSVIITCVILVAYVGRPGAILSLIAGEILIIVFYSYLFIKISREVRISQSEINQKEYGAIS